MRRLALLPLVLLACRYLAPAQQAWTPARPYTASGAKEAPLVANRCGVACGVGFHCDEKSATCSADEQNAVARDGGPAWIP